jgi:putative addiction module component (TIGR02574 family)
MRAMKKIIEDAESLPVEERVVVIDSLLRTINAPLADVDTEWMNVAKRRLAELRFGQVKAVPGNEVFARVRSRFEK